MSPQALLLAVVSTNTLASALFATDEAIGVRRNTALIKAGADLLQFVSTQRRALDDARSPGSSHFYAGLVQCGA
jgi:hypothetical protein